MFMFYSIHIIIEDNTDTSLAKKKIQRTNPEMHFQ